LRFIFSFVVSPGLWVLNTINAPSTTIIAITTTAITAITVELIPPDVELLLPTDEESDDVGEELAPEVDWPGVLVGAGEDPGVVAAGVTIGALLCKIGLRDSTIKE
jgi:hypothetical protein